jgi:ABC-type Fe3+ transport system permease subunit
MLDWELSLVIIMLISIAYDFYCTRIKREGWFIVRRLWLCFAAPALVLAIGLLIFGLWCASAIYTRSSE